VIQQQEKTQMPNVLVPLAEGFEELEAISVIDILRRAEVDVVVAGLSDGPVKASRGTNVLPDMSLDDALQQDYDMIVLPGGMPGASNLNDDARVHELLKKMANSGKFTGAICAAPMVLGNAGVLDGKRATSFPGFVDQMDLPTVDYTGVPVERDGKVITSRGAGTALDFALELVDALVGREKRDEVEAALQRPQPNERVAGSN
jgi:4-methyl-5(b-hydroxyethyl)-thiazole monophosphate biosynthesis